MVTQSVPELSQREIGIALERGLDVAKRLEASGLIRAAALNLQGEMRILGSERCAPSENISRLLWSPAHA